MKSTLIAFIALSFSGFYSVNAFSAMKEKTVEYKQGEAVLEGFLSYNTKGPKKKPAVIIVHNWNGITKEEMKCTTQVAKLGYVAFAADIYGKGIRPTGDEAASLSSSYKKNIPLMRDRIRAAYDEVAKMPNVDPKRIAVMGYCFGGTVALELARSGADILGVVTFHGGLATPDPKDAKNIKGRVLVLHGADDPYVNEKEVLAFQKEMRDAKVDWEMISYGNAVHAFTEVDLPQDNSAGAAYNPTADRRSWKAMKDFFKEIFKK
jgi:dienelactone hydrolase